MNDLLYVILVTLLPWVELRGSIPLAIAMGYSPLSAFLLCTAVNILIMFPVFVFLDLFFPFVYRHFPVFEHAVMSTREKGRQYVRKYGVIGLALFVAVPLPGTGVYSGVLAAYLLGLSRHRTYTAISLGALFAGVLVTLLSTGFVFAFGT